MKILLHNMVMVDKSNWLLKRYLTLCKGVISQSHCCYKVRVTVAIALRNHPFYCHSKDKGLKCSTVWVLDGLISLQSESLSV